MIVASWHQGVKEKVLTEMLCRLQKQHSKSMCFLVYYSNYPTWSPSRCHALTSMICSELMVGHVLLWWQLSLILEDRLHRLDNGIVVCLDMLVHQVPECFFMVFLLIFPHSRNLELMCISIELSRRI